MILKTEVERKQRTPNFPKNEFMYPLIRPLAYQGLRNVRFSENLLYFVLFPPS